jgi:uncharacterized SAM-binding protein YcdF (DUF218 family)
MAMGLVACTNDLPTGRENIPDKNHAEPDTQASNESLPSIESMLDITLHTKVPDDLPTEDHAFVVLGSALSSDGEMKETLLNRLQVALKAAKQYPHSKIIVSGGAPKSGVTEASVMDDWLVANGLRKDRIVQETESTDTIENALFSMTVAEEEHIKDLTLITSASHMRRAYIVFNIVNYKYGDIIHSLSNVVYMDYDNQEAARQITTKEKALIYRDYLRARAIPD